jgi:hypothetical protein
MLVVLTILIYATLFQLFFQNMNSDSYLSVKVDNTSIFVVPWENRVGPKEIYYSSLEL